MDAGAGHSADAIKVLAANPEGAARDEREPFLAGLGGSNETREPTSGVGSNPLGNGEAEAESSGDFLSGDEPPMKVDAILAKWEAESIGQDYRPKTQIKYRWAFRTFAESCNLETHNRAWLAKNGLHAVKEWVMALPEKSRAICYAGLQSVWTFGIEGVPWPANKKRDFGRKVFVQPGHRPCPEDSDIEPIFRASQREDDPYLKSLVLTGLCMGGRPGNQLGQFRWGDVREFNSTLAIVAESKAGRKFKTNSPVIARLPPIASEAIRTWKAHTKYAAPDDWIWPRRPHGELTNRKSDDHTMAKEYGDFLDRHLIVTWVRMCHFRDWVEYRQQRDGVHQILVAYLRGHAVASATEGALGYSSNRKVEKVLGDQETEWVSGPCGIFTAREVHVVDELTPYMAVIAEYSKGDMNTDEMARKIESVRLKTLKPAVGIAP